MSHKASGLGLTSGHSILDLVAETTSHLLLPIADHVVGDAELGEALHLWKRWVGPVTICKKNRHYSRRPPFSFRSTDTRSRQHPTYVRTYVRMYIRMGMSASIRIRMRRPLFLIDTGDGLRPKTRSDGNQIVTASKAARERVALGNRQSEDFSSSHAGAATAAPNIDAKMAAVGANPPAVPGASRTKQTPAGFPERNYPNKARHLKALTATAVRLAAAEVASTPRRQMENVTSRNK